MVLAWENLQEVFVMLVVVVVFLTASFYVSGLLFLASGTPPWLLRPVKASTRSELYPGYFQLLYFCQAFTSQFYLERYGFWVGIFYLQEFFTLRSFTNIFGTFCDSGEGRNIPSRILLCAFPHRIVPSGWRMDLNYSHCSYQLRQWATKYKVKTELLNMFRLFKVIWKNYKNALNKTW